MAEESAAQIVQISAESIIDTIHDQQRQSAPLLTADVLIKILELSAKDSLLSAALSNKLLRSLCLPVLFRQLRIGPVEYTDVTESSADQMNRILFRASKPFAPLVKELIMGSSESFHHGLPPEVDVLRHLPSFQNLCHIQLRDFKLDTYTLFSLCEIRGLSSIIFKNCSMAAEILPVAGLRVTAFEWENTYSASSTSREYARFLDLINPDLIQIISLTITDEDACRVVLKKMGTQNTVRHLVELHTVNRENIFLDLLELLPSASKLETLDLTRSATINSGGSKPISSQTLDEFSKHRIWIPSLVTFRGDQNFALALAPPNLRELKLTGMAAAAEDFDDLNLLLRIGPLHHLESLTVFTGFLRRDYIEHINAHFSKLKQLHILAPYAPDPNYRFQGLVYPHQVNLVHYFTPIVTYSFV